MRIIYFAIVILCYTGEYRVHMNEICAQYTSPIIIVDTPTQPEKKITCCFDGYQFVGWKKNKKTITGGPYTTVMTDENSSTITLRNPAAEAMSSFSCTFRNAIGATQTLYMVVTKNAAVNKFKPIQHISILKDETIYYGSSNVLDSPIQWSMRGNSKPLIVYDPAKATRPQRGRYVVDGFGNLMIKSVNSSDAGIFAASLLKTDGSVIETKQFEVFVGAAPFRATYPLASYHFTVGDIGIIQCSTYGMDLNNYWLYHPNGSSTSKRLERDNLDKYQMEVEGTLRINNIKSTDIGTYTCVSENNFGTISSSTKIIGVITPAKIFRLNNGYGRVGSSVSIVCEVEGNPIPIISWWRNNQPISNYRMVLDNTSALFFDYMTQGDSGIYACVADNNATKNGKPTYDARDVELYNEEKPFINANLSTSFVIVSKYNSVATLRCVSENLPFSRLYLMFNGSEIKEAGISVDKEMNQIVLTYIFSYTEKNQLGVYKCVAENSFGYDSLDMAVGLMDEPDPPTNIRVSHIDTTSALIRWDYPAFYLESRYHDFQLLIFTANHLSYNTILEKKDYVQVEGLFKNTTYHIQIRSHLISGWSDPSKTVSFRTLEVGAPHPPSILNNVLFLDGIDIHLVWEYPMRNFNDSNYVFSVEWCRMDYFNISDVRKHCNFMSNLYSTEFMITGLSADNFYVIGVGASNFLGSRVSREFIVIAGKNPYIGAITSTLDSIFISLIVILLLLLIIWLIDLIMLCLYCYGVTYFLFKIFSARWPKECSCKAKYTRCETTEVARIAPYNPNLDLDNANVYRHEVIVTSLTPNIPPELIDTSPVNEHTPVAFAHSDRIPYAYETENNRVRFVNFNDKKNKSYGKSLRIDPNSNL